MLSRWLPPTNEASSILRLLNLLPFACADTALILCGPFYLAVDFFRRHTDPPHPLSPSLQKKIYTPLDPNDPVQRALAWRVALLGHLTTEAGVLGITFPLECRRTVLSRLVTVLDSHFPLLEVVDSGLALKDIYARNLAPEQCHHTVVDSSLTCFIPLLVPHILTHSVPIPILAYELAGCPVGDPGMDSLVSLFRQICVRREKMRSFLSTLFHCLCGDGQSNWLRETIVAIVKTALLGNYPDSTAFVDLSHRRGVYRLTHETILQFLGACAGDRARETELAAALSLLATALVGTFSPNSTDYVPMDGLVYGWTDFFRTNQRIMQLLVDFYPLPPPSNLMLDIFRFLTPLRRRFENIFYLIHSQIPSALDFHLFWPLHPLLLEPQTCPTTLDLLVAIILDLSPTRLRLVQIEFDTLGTFRPCQFSESELGRLAQFSRYLVDRWATRLVPGSTALYFEQSRRMLQITGRLAKEKSTVLFCRKCNTVRFRPVGVHLPASHITLLADLNFTRVYCVDCDGSDIVPMNLMGNFVRCYLSTKKTRTLVTLTLCSACMHICVVGNFHTAHGVICSECTQTVSALTALPASKQCLNCTTLVQRPDADQFVTVLEKKGLVTGIWCSRCMPTHIRQGPRLLLDEGSVKFLSNPPVSVPLRYRFY